MSAPAAPQPGSRRPASPASTSGATRETRATIGPERVTGAQSVVRSLEEIGTDIVFGIPGGAILPVYDPLYDSTRVRHVLVRHEQGGGHAATGYAQASGRVGVCMATSGPGATNLVTPLADAMMDSVPVVAITGQVGTSLIGTDAFQEADISGITMPITKHNFLVSNARDIPQIIAQAFLIARTGRPGPVLVDIPKSVLQAETTFSWPPQIDLPGYRPVTQPHGKQIREAARLIAQAKRPVFYIGGGVIKADAHKELRALAEFTGIPVVTTLMAKGSFPDAHDLHFGMPGMHGDVSAVAALQKSDLLITIGARFDDRVTGKLSGFAPHAKVIHADVDPAEIGKNRAVDVPIVGDAREVLAALLETVKADPQSPTRDLTSWLDFLRDLRSTFARGWEEPADGKLAPQHVISRLSTLAGPEAIYVAGVGQHQMWAAQFIDYEHPRTWLNSGGLGTMGYSVPAAMGAKMACPEREVWSIDGDGCFQMTNQELATCAVEGVPIKVAIINNGNLGMVRQWQTLFYEERYSNTNLKPLGHYIPDMVALAEALGCAARRVESAAEVDEAIEWARSINDRPVVIDFIVGEDSQVWPMVAAGTTNDEIMYARNLRPLFEEDESAGEDFGDIDDAVSEADSSLGLSSSSAPSVASDSTAATDSAAADSTGSPASAATEAEQ